MKRAFVFVPYAAWLALGTSACFSGSSGAPGSSGADAATGETPDAEADVQGSDATTAEGGAVLDEASTFDAGAGIDATEEAASEVEASAGDGSAGDGSAEAAPPIDAGAGCIPPGAESPLSATTEGYPTAGLVLWLRADHGLYVTAAKRVCAWADQSGNGTILSNPGPTLPLLVGSGGSDGGTGTGPDGGAIGGIGGQPGVYFDAPGSSLAVGEVLGIPATGARTFIIVTRMVATAGRFESIAQGQGGSAGTYVMIDANTWQSAGNLEGVYLTNNSYDTALATSTDPRVHVLTVSGLTVDALGTDSMDYRVNGATQSFTLKAGSGYVASFSAANYTSIGSVDTTNSVGSAGTGVIAEALIYSRALDVSERLAIETALMARYGVQ